MTNDARVKQTAGAEQDTSKTLADKHTNGDKQKLTNNAKGKEQIEQNQNKSKEKLRILQTFDSGAKRARRLQRHFLEISGRSGARAGNPTRFVERVKSLMRFV